MQANMRDVLKHGTTDCMETKVMSVHVASNVK